MSKQIDERILQFYQPKKLLGSGAYGHVWKVIQKSTKKEYALKKIFDAFQNSVDAQRTYRQITVLHQLEHSNIIKLRQVARATNNRDLYLVFQYMQADLHSLVGEDVLQPVHLKFVIYQILKALKYLHSAQLIHRDLKPSNILINSECQIKICDFGLVRSLTHQEDHQMVLSEEVATRWYRSPQILLSSTKYTKATDVWSVGCIIAQLLIGKPIFPGNSTLDQLDLIVQFCGIPSKQTIDSLQSEAAQNLINQLSVRKKSVTDYFPLNCDKQVLKLVLRMLQFSPNKRITIDEALNSPLLNEFNSNKQENQLCEKIILPQVDDNVRLTVAKYRQIIYKDIQRRYPLLNLNYNSLNTTISAQSDSRGSHNNTVNQKQPTQTIFKYQRSHHSLKKINNDKSIHHQGKNSSSSLQKPLSNTTSTMYSKANKSKQNQSSSLHHSFSYQKAKDSKIGSYIEQKRQQVCTNNDQEAEKKIKNSKYTPYQKKEKHFQKQSEDILRQRSQNSIDPNRHEQINKGIKSRNKKVLRRIEQSNPLKCYLVKQNKFLPKVLSKKNLLHKTTINKACKPLVDFHQKIGKLRT